LRTSGVIDVQFEFSHFLDEASYNTKVDIQKIYGDDRVGLISMDEPSITGDKATLFVRSDHVPRNIDSIKIKFQTDRSVEVGLPSKENGGLLDGWSLQKEEENSWIASSETPIQFGNIGLLFQVTINEIPEDKTLTIPVEIDNNIYPPVDLDRDGIQDKRLEISPNIILLGEEYKDNSYPPPSNLNLIQEGHAINVTGQWNSAVPSDELPVEFDLFRMENGGPWMFIRRIGSGQTYFVDSDVFINGTYSYRVVSKFENLDSNPSSEASMIVEMGEMEFFPEEENGGSSKLDPWVVTSLLVLFLAIIALVIFLTVLYVRYKAKMREMEDTVDLISFDMD
jgi:hypothetical protein